jgi:hypothetical protein
MCGVLLIVLALCESLRADNNGDGALNNVGVPVLWFGYTNDGGAFGTELAGTGEWGTSGGVVYGPYRLEKVGDALVGTHWERTGTSVAYWREVTATVRRVGGSVYRVDLSSSLGASGTCYMLVGGHFGNGVRTSPTRLPADYNAFTNSPPLCIGYGANLVLEGGFDLPVVEDNSNDPATQPTSQPTTVPTSQPVASVTAPDSTDEFAVEIPWGSWSSAMGVSNPMPGGLDVHVPFAWYRASTLKVFVDAALLMLTSMGSGWWVWKELRRA